MEILVLTQHILPLQTPRSFRSTELIKELANQGHHVTCYAVLGKYDYSQFLSRYPNIQLKNIPLKYSIKPFTSDGIPNRPLIDKVLGKLLGTYLFFPYIEFIKRIPEIIKNENQFDLIISIADPHPIHWGTAKAKQKFPDKFPKTWIADCGDPFMDNGRANYPTYFAKFERKFCALADKITVPVKEAIQGYYPEFRDKIYVIPQGFQFDLNQQNTFVSNAIPQFAFTGMFYKDIRNPQNLLQYLTSLSQNFVFHVYTPYTDLIKEFETQLGDKLKIHPTIPREKLLIELQKMDFVINLENSNSPNQIPSKLIDYAIVQKPILSLNPENIDSSKIQEFLQGNYQNQFHVNNLEQYHISNVVQKFIELV
jgi:hypothetical protein